MPIFVYQAKKGSGEVIKGSIEAENESGAAFRLKQSGYWLFTLNEKGREKTDFFSPRTFMPLRSRDVTLFTRQLSDLLDAGIPVTESLSILIRQAEDFTMGKVIEDLRNNVQSGITLSESLAKHPRIFSPLYVGMVHAGEGGGMLKEVLERLAVFSEKQEEIKGRLKAAMAYPLLLFSVGVITVFVLLTFILPKFVVMFRDLEQVLPLPTRILIGSSTFMHGYWWLILSGTFLLFFGMQRFCSTPKGKLSFDHFRLNVPLLGKIIRKAEVANLTRTLGALLENGVAILPSLKITQTATGNRAIAQDVVRVYEGVNKGKRLGELLAKSPYFLPFEVGMITVGEETGKLEQMLLKVAVAYEQEVDRSVKVLNSLLEPAMILVMGGFVGFIVFSILLPIFRINVLIK